MSPEQLDAIEARANAATRGPWRWEQYRDDLHYLVGRRGSPETYEYDTGVMEPEHNGECGCRSACHLEMQVSKEDREFTAYARTDVPALVAEVRRLHRIRAVLEDPTIHATKLRERALDELEKA